MRARDCALNDQNRKCRYVVAGRPGGTTVSRRIFLIVRARCGARLYVLKHQVRGERPVGRFSLFESDRMWGGCDGQV